MLILAFSGSCAAGAASTSDLAQRVLVVFNSQSRPSRQVAEYYIARRGIPFKNKCGVKPESTNNPGNETIDVGAFDRLIKKPIQRCLAAVGKDKILYIVLAYDMPYKVNAPTGPGVALDQYIADVWDLLPSTGRVLNPYFGNAQPKAGQYARFVALAEYRARPEAKTIYSVWRLDGASPALAKGLVDKALMAEEHGATGRACFDRRYGDLKNIADTGYGSGDWEVYRAAQFAREAGFAVTEDSNEAELGTPPAPARCDDALLYAGWYSLNHYNDAFTWRPGAIGIHLDSASAANPRGGENWSANAIKRGITVTAGAVGEPFLQGLPRPDGIVLNLFDGANVGDAFLRNTLWLKWMIINIGDPLYRPFANKRAPFR